MANGFTRDIGGGVVTATSPGLTQLLTAQIAANRKGTSEGTTELNKLRALRLEQQIEQGPLDLKRKEIDTALKVNELLNVNIGNEIKRINLQRQQSGQAVERIGQLNDAFGTNFSQGQFILQNAIPGATSVQNKDGTISITVPSRIQGRDAKEFVISPRQIRDPEKRIAVESKNRAEFKKGGKDFKLQSQFFRSMKDLAKQATAQADIGIVFSFMKLLDPTSVVREGEQATARNSPGVPERIINLYNRALTTDAPLFGGRDSPTRQKFIDAGEVLFENAKSDLIADAQTMAVIARKNGLDVESIVVPIGGVDFLREISKASPDKPPPKSDGLGKLTLEELKEIAEAEGTETTGAR